jgi:hypothetical protein
MPCTHSEFTLDDIYVLLCKGFMKVWAVADRDNRIQFVMVTEFVQYPQYKSVRVVLLAGRLLKRISKQFSQAFEEYAFNHGAVEIEGWVAPGMARFLQHLGFSATYTVVRKSLRGKLQ